MKPCVADAGIGLMAAPRLGKTDAEQLVERHAERVYRLALRITKVTQDAEEIVEDALRTAARAAHHRRTRQHAEGAGPGLTSRVHRARLFVRKRLSKHFEPEKSCGTDPVNRSGGAQHLIG